MQIVVLFVFLNNFQAPFKNDPKGKIRNTKEKKENLTDSGDLRIAVFNYMSFGER
jgi:hypothetical protein